jgi:glutamate synthase (ferredoxin)
VQRASEAVAAGYTILILSDRGVDATRRRFRACWPRPACTITWCARARARAARWSSSRATRARCITCALLIGYGAGAVNPYLAFETLDDMIRQALLEG